MYFLASPSLRRKSFGKGRLTYIRDSTCNRELKRKLHQVLFEGAMRRPCGPNYGSQITMKTTSVKIAVRQIMLGRQAACMCLWNSLGTTSRGIYDSDSSLGSSAQQSHRVSLSELPDLELSFVLKLSSAKRSPELKRSSAHLCSSAQFYGSNDKAGVFMGVVTQREGH